MRAWPRWSKIEAVEHPAAYVSKIVLNVFLNGRRRRVLPRVALPDDIPDPADAPARHDQRDALVAALRGLAPRQRAVIALRYLEDLSERQVADTLGCSIGTVKSTSAKALRALRGMPEIAELGPEEVRE